MQSLLPLILAAFFVYLLFFRKGGMGCCGAHGDHGTEPDMNRKPETLHSNAKGDIIDLRKDQYTVLPMEDDMDPKTVDKAALKQ